MEELDYAILGSGPVGLISALSLLRSGKYVTVFDIGSTPNNPKVLPASFQGKAVLGDTFPYDLKFTENVQPDLKEHFYTSQGRFGFSTVWGATWRRFNSMSTEDWLELETQLDKIMLDAEYAELPRTKKSFRFDQTKTCSCLGKELKKAPTHIIQIGTPQLLINGELCDWKGVCQTGCPNFAIWSSEEIFRACTTYQTFNYVPDYRLHSFIQEKENLKLKFENGKVIKSKKLILGIGPVASAVVLLNSGIQNSFTLSDNQIKFRLFFSMRKLELHKNKFGLSTMTLDYMSSNYKTHIQMYPHLNQSSGRIQRSVPTYLRGLSNYFFEKLSSRLAIGLVFHDQKISDGLKIELTDSGPLVSKVSHPFRKLKWCFVHFKLYSVLRYTRLIPIPFAAKSAVAGASYHTGAAQNPSWDEFGILNSTPNVGIAGALALHELEPGPITKSAMMQAMMLVSKMLK